MQSVHPQFCIFLHYVYRIGLPCPDNGLYIGITTRQLLNRLEHNGEISPTHVKEFYQAVRGFYHTAAEYGLANLPLRDEVLRNAWIVNFEKRETALLSQVEFYVKRYKDWYVNITCLLPTILLFSFIKL